jgi:magnesium transporter
VIVDCALYEHGVRRPGRFDLAELSEVALGHDVFVWIGLYEPTHEEFDEARAAFNLHELAVEDAVHAHQRPKLEHYGDSLFMVLKTAEYHDDIEDVEFGEIQVFLGDGFVVHVRHGKPSSLSRVRHTLEQHRDLLECGPTSVLHAIVDHVVDGYEPVVRGIENDVNEVERQVFSGGRHQNPVERIYQLKRMVLELYDDLEPLRDPLQQLSVDRFRMVHDDMQEYFRDVHDHLARLVERVVQFRELLTSVLAANLTQVGLQQNEDMRKISAWVALAAVPTMVAGIYGMNFEFMPELSWQFGYPLVLGVMALVVGYMYWRFKKADWL